MKNKKPNKKKQNQQGFTLIELLAVITIMGILMMVAIPSVSRTIENSRRDTFKDTGLAYLAAIKNSVAQDELTCNSKPISAVDAGYYYYAFSSTKASGTDLMQSGGKSSWGNAEVAGVIMIKKSVDGTRTKYEYSMEFVDSVGRGFGTAKATDDGTPINTIKEDNIKRSVVSTKNDGNRKVFYDAYKNAENGTAPTKAPSKNNTRFGTEDADKITTDIYRCTLDM